MSSFLPYFSLPIPPSTRQASLKGRAWPSLQLGSTFLQVLQWKPCEVTFVAPASTSLHLGFPVFKPWVFL